MDWESAETANINELIKSEERSSNQHNNIVDGSNNCSDNDSGSESSELSADEGCSSAASSATAPEDFCIGDDVNYCDVDAADDDNDVGEQLLSSDFEAARIGNTLLCLPKLLCEDVDVFREFFSIATWQSLRQEQQANLGQFLPRESSAAEQQRTIERLFDGDLTVFGRAPLIEFQHQLMTGHFRPDIVALRRKLARAERKQARFQYGEYLSTLGRQIFAARRNLLDAWYKSSPLDLVSGELLPLAQKAKPKLTVNREQQICVSNARKRYCEELDGLARDCGMDIEWLVNNVSEEDGPTLAEFSGIAKRRKVMQKASDETAIAGGESKYAYSTKKRVYNTTFRRYAGIDDEVVLRSTQNSRYRRLTDKTLNAALRDFKRRKLTKPNDLEFDFGEIRLRDICTRAHFTGNFKPGRRPKHKQQQQQESPPTNKAQPMATETPATTKQNEQHSTKNANALKSNIGQSLLKIKHEKSPSPAQTQKPLPNNMLSPAKQVVSSMSPSAIVAPAMIQETHSSYFSLMRDFFCATANHRMRFDELRARIDIWLNNPITALNDWYRQVPNWLTLLPSAVGFLAGVFPIQPKDYVPFIEHKPEAGIYQWIGAGRDSDAKLMLLCQFWLQQRKLISKDPPTATPTATVNQESKQELAQSPPTPPPRWPTNWLMRTATDVEILEFQRQERARFEQPHRAFTYRMYGYESVVGPVKGVYAPTSGQPPRAPRGHNILIDDRPTFVNILTLVGDATARLPNGEGTRSDISALLKCSQFINPNAADNSLQTVISGALDRMHGGHDPCVRYDAKRKIWIYLHRNRNEAEFERLHKLTQSQSAALRTKPNFKRRSKPKSGGADCDDVDVVVPTPVPANNASLLRKNAAPQAPQIVLSNPTLKCPPLKYNVPQVNQQQPRPQQLQQKSLLKTIGVKPGGEQQHVSPKPAPSGNETPIRHSFNASAGITIAPPPPARRVQTSNASPAQVIQATSAAGATTKKLMLNLANMSKVQMVNVLASPSTAVNTNSNTKPHNKSINEEQQAQKSPQATSTMSPKNVRIMPPNTAKFISKCQQQAANLTAIRTNVSASTMLKVTPQHTFVSASNSIQHAQAKLIKATSTSTQLQQLVSMGDGNANTALNKQIVIQTHPLQQQQRLVSLNKVGQTPNVVGTKSLQQSSSQTAQRQGPPRILVKKMKQWPITKQDKPLQIVVENANKRIANQVIARPMTSTSTPTLKSTQIATNQVITIDGNIVQKPGNVMRVGTTMPLAKTTSMLNAQKTNANAMQFTVISPRSTTNVGQTVSLAGAAVSQTVATKTLAGRIITMPAHTAGKLIGKSATVMPNSQHKAGLITDAAKNANTFLRPTTASGVKIPQLQNVILANQPIKIQSMVQQQQAEQIAAKSGTPMQTFILGNQILRLQPAPRLAVASTGISSNSSTTTTTTTTTTAGTPKTYFINSGGQQLRLQGITNNRLLMATSNAGGGNKQTLTNFSNVLSLPTSNQIIFTTPSYQQAGGSGQSAVASANIKPMKIVNMPFAASCGTVKPQQKVILKPFSGTVRKTDGNGPRT